MNLRQKIGVFLGTLIIALSIGAVAASAASAAGRPLGPYRIMSLDKCLDVTGVSQSNGAHLQLYDCLPQQYNQRFYLYPQFGGGYQIVAAHSGKCLDVEGVSYATGANIQQYDCIGPNQTNQIFVQRSFQGGVFQLVALHSGKCMTVTGWSNGDGVIQGTYEGGPGSWWSFQDPI